MILAYYCEKLTHGTTIEGWQNAWLQCSQIVIQKLQEEYPEVKKYKIVYRPFNVPLIGVPSTLSITIDYFTNSILITHERMLTTLGIEYTRQFEKLATFQKQPILQFSNTISVRFLHPLVCLNLNSK